jgi:hypothetical protein
MPQHRWNAATAKLWKLTTERFFIEGRHERGLVMPGDARRLEELMAVEEEALEELEAADGALWEHQKSAPEKA